ncbi:MAG: hypothetical protein LAN64_20640 [Acidobacteriia bacterium]|nr:hypothetical protein [Terriglobia bacterium]
MSLQLKFHFSLFERLGIRWCRMMHNSPMWPMRGHYRCRTCGRNFLIAWASARAAEPVQIWIRPEQRVTRHAA